MRRLTSALRGFQTTGTMATRLANLCVALIWSKNTANYLAWVGKPPNYIQPAGWSEKMQWRKIFDHNPLFAVFADKIEARRYAERLGANVHFPSILWTGTEPAEIPFDQLTEPFVIKPNNGSGDIFIAQEPTTVDRDAARALCRKWLLRKPYGRREGEWGYRRVRQQIIIEEFLPGPDASRAVSNYKFFVVSGTVLLVQLESKREGQYHLTFFTRDGKRWPVRKWIGRLRPEQMPKPDPAARLPAQFGELIRAAETLGAQVDHVRVDLYWVDDKIYFSELTPYDGSGYSYFYEETEQFEVRPSYRLDLELGAAWTQPAIPFREKLRALFWT